MKHCREDLIEFLRWNSNAPMKVLNRTSTEDLEKFMTIHNAWDRFYAHIEAYRGCWQAEKVIRKAGF